VDGLIVASSHATRRHAERLRDVGRPVVLLNSPSQELGIGGISSDHRAGARLGAAHLLELGHRGLAHLGASPEVAAAAAPRRAGVEDAVADAGLDPANILTVVGEPTVAGGASAMEELLRAGGRPTGIACYNDLMAIGALRALRLAGLAVPQDVSVVGFDDIDLAAWTDPALTTVAQPTAELGRLAVERLATWSADGSANAEWQSLAPYLVVRETTSPHGPSQGAA
jgi:LacI family transcriptional regulator